MIQKGIIHGDNGLARVTAEKPGRRVLGIEEI
jgi:hypothetical protein